MLHDELQIATQHNVPIVPIRIHDVPAPLGHGNLQMSDPIGWKQATSTIPIVFFVEWQSGQCRARRRLRPATRKPHGVAFTGPKLEGKRLQILKDVVPRFSRAAVLWNAASMGVEFYRQTEAAAAALSVTLQPVVQASRTDDFERAFETIGRARPDALIVLADRLLLSHRNEIVAFAANRRLPGMYPYKEYVEAGGLLSYAPSNLDRFRRRLSMWTRY